jgi:asparagine synthase (glutamine-hydrolysing)
MCGICGQYNFGTQERVDIENIRRMTETIMHRGPDDEGTYISGELGLGFRRLSIIDLVGGAQPMSDDRKKIWIVFNGEIYNHQQLRHELISHGHAFRTKSDTEVIIYGYKQWGEEVLNRLNGMFGFAIWDEEKKKLLLARDRAGIKGIFYKLDEGRLLFGSEIRPIAASLGERLEPDPTALNLFLRYRYTPSPLTIYKGIRKLGAGTKLVVENGRVREERWWCFKPTLFDPAPTIAEAQEQLLELYKQAVKRQLMSDVPLGLLLSGGLDSGLLLALMNLYGKDWKTFTVGFGESYRDDELKDAEATARGLNAPNYSVRIDRTAFEDTLAKTISIMEDPIASPSAVLMYYVCQRARQDVKVALIGQGPDELMGGYKRHVGLRYGGYWRRMPGWGQAAVAAAIRKAPRNEMMKRGVSSLGETDRIERYQQIFSVMSPQLVNRLFRDGFRPESRNQLAECWNGLMHMIEGTDELGGFQFLEARSSLPDELLMYSDKISMHHGLEVRVPYLDHDIIEYVERLPAAYKVRWCKRKWLHARICQQFLPRTVLQRKKRGFGYSVVDDWYRDSMASRISDLLLDGQAMIYRYLEPKTVRELITDHRCGRHDHHKVLFNLVVMEQWMRGDSYRSPSAAYAAGAS